MMLRILAMVLIAACTAAAAADLASQSSSKSGVTVKAAPRLAAEAWDFEIAFDTHSQDLSDDLLKSAALALDGGAPATPTAWQGDPPGGHHRKGVLRFKAPTAQPQEMELRIARPGEAAPRIFRWKLR